MELRYGVTLITSIVASHPFNLAETYSLVGSYIDKSDNLHFNGDYQKALICFHVVKLVGIVEKTIGPS